MRTVRLMAPVRAAARRVAEEGVRASTNLRDLGWVRLDMPIYYTERRTRMVALRAMAASSGLRSRTSYSLTDLW